MNIEGKTDKQLQEMCIDSWEHKLELSVEDIRKGKGLPGGRDCAFCVKYNVNSGACRGCPVGRKTSRALKCVGTPYRAALALYRGIGYKEHCQIKAFRKAVQKAIDFLKALECDG